MFSGLKVEDGIRAKEMIHLFFVNDTLLFREQDAIAIINIRCVLLSFQIVLSLISTKLSLNW